LKNLDNIVCYLNYGTIGANTMNPEEFIRQVYSNPPDDLRQLLANGADPNILNSNNRAALLITVDMQWPNKTKMLIEFGADVNIIGRSNSNSADDRWTPLHFAIYHNDLYFVRLLLSSGADMGIVMFGDTTAYEYAKSCGYNQLAELIEQYDFPVKGVHCD